MATVALAVLPATAGAVIEPPQVIAGPSPDLLDVDGSALAPDGTGGIVMRELSDGVPHIFVVRFIRGRMLPPIQVDAGQPGPATMPAIAAADHGELLVTWVEPWKLEATTIGAQATLHYRLMSAVLGPGATSFGEVEPIDDVGDGTAAYPSLALSANGARGYVVYRVVTDPLTGDNESIQPERPGDELVDVRVAEFTGAYWSGLGPVNHLPGEVTMRRPSPSNAPQVAIDPSGTGVVVWQEPDLTGYARIWARRLYGSTLGDPIQISPSTFDGQPVDVDADAPAVGYDEVALASFRLQGGVGSPFPGLQPQLFSEQVPAMATQQANATPPTDIGGGPVAGPPSVGTDIDGGNVVAGTLGAATITEAGDATTPLTLGPATPGDPAFTVPAPGGGALNAWPGASATGLPVVDARETFPGGTPQTAALSAPLSGPIQDLSMGTSPLGDGLIGWMQGPTNDQQAVAAYAQAPPGMFTASTAKGWVRPRAARVSWDPAPDAFGGVTYSVFVNGRLQASGLHGPSAGASPTDPGRISKPVSQTGEQVSISHRLGGAGLGDGTYRIQVIATDADGQQTGAAPVTLKVDASPPTIAVAHLSRDRLRVTVSDDASGVDVSRTRIAFGDPGRREVTSHAVRRPKPTKPKPTKPKKPVNPNVVTGHDVATHAYPGPGRYTLTISAVDNVGNRRHVALPVVVR